MLLFTLCFSYRVSATALPYTIIHFTEKEGFSQSIVMSIIQDSTGYIWLASWDGLIRYDGYRFKTYKARPGDTCPLETNRIDALCEMSDGIIVCKSNGKLYYFDSRSEAFTLAHGEERKFSSFKADANTLAVVKSIPEFQHANARILLVDRQNGIWVVSNRGLDRLSPKTNKKSPTQYGTQSEEVIRAIYQDKSQRVWMADKQGYVRIITSEDKKQVVYLSPTGQLTNVPVSFGEKVYAIMEDGRGNIWMGCKPGGLYCLKPQGKKCYHVEHYTHLPDDSYSLSNENVYSIAEDLYGNLWVGTFGGGINLVTTGDDGSIRFIHAGNLLKSYPHTASFVYDLYAHSEGILFIGTNNGLYTCFLTPEIESTSLSFNTYRKESKDICSLSNNWVTDMIPDTQENLYIATYGGGLNYLNVESVTEGKAQFIHYTHEDGLASDIIIALTRDYKENIWCASGAALSCFNPHTETSTNYMQGYFTDDFSFVESGLLYLNDSTLMTGTTRGILLLRPDEIGKSDFVPYIAFDCSKSIRLKPHEKTLTVSFAALDYNKNVPIHYAYKVGDKSQVWNYITDCCINLSDIPAGTTKLYVRSTNGDGVWVGNQQSITIHRTPYFNERPVAWMLYGGLVLLSIGLFVKTVQYIRNLKAELTNIRLTTGETIEYLTTKLQDSLSRREEKKVATPLIEIANNEDEIFREKVDNFIVENLSNADLNIEDFAREIGVSRSVLYLQMKRLFDCTPNVYLCDVRMNHARQMMDAGHTNISDVAYRCGYSDPKYFSRCFKKSVGMTPSDYLKANAVNPNYSREENG